ncbi:MAG: Nif3-like dinuclear metal center hexameric protein [Chitinophagales bacterium]
MILQEIISHLESIAPKSLQESYDNSGLLVGDSNMEINSAVIALDVTEAVVYAAIKNNSNLIIAHHPIIFGGIKKLTGSNFVERILIEAIKNNIAIYAIHTNLDNIKNGVNTAFAEALGLQNLRVLKPMAGQLYKLVTFAPHTNAADIRQAMFNAGAGNIGNYDECSFNTEGTGTFRGNDDSNPVIGERGITHAEPETRIEVIYPKWKEAAIMNALKKAHPYEEVAYDILPLANKYQNIGAGMIGSFTHPMQETFFLESVKVKMKTECVRHTALLHKSIKKVAICGGSGSFLLQDAIRAGADAFISADFKYHQFFDADNKILIADIGHYESEQFTIPLIANLLQKKFPNFALHFSSINTNPVNYL